MYSTGDKSKIPGAIVHVGGDPDNPVTRGTAIARALVSEDMMQSAHACKWPEVRRQQRVEAHLVARGHQAHRRSSEGGPRRNFVTAEQGWHHRLTVGRPLLRIAAPAHEEPDTSRSEMLPPLGVTRSIPSAHWHAHGGQSGSEFWAWCDDQPLELNFKNSRSDLGDGRQPMPGASRKLRVRPKEAKKQRKAELIVVDPRLMHGLGVPTCARHDPSKGSNIAFFGYGVIDYLLSSDRIPAQSTSLCMPRS